MKKIFLITILGVISMLGSCKSRDLNYYNNTKPEFNLREYFTGNIKAWGIIQDWRGRVSTKFDVDMVGSWEGNTGTLEEDFTFYDGKKQQRTWKILQNKDGTYLGSAHDIIGNASGESSGSAMNWKYSMYITVDNSTYRVKFDDWMWQMNDGIVINRSYIKKFGITVAELTLFMKKKDWVNEIQQ